MREAARAKSGISSDSTSLDGQAGDRWTAHARVRTRPRRKGWKLYETVRLLLRWLRWWVRLEVRGLENLPARGPILIVSNHDAWLDPLVILESMMWKGRQLRFLAKASLWKFEPFAWVLDGAGQIPIRRVQGGTDVKRFPRRPRVKIEFFQPQGGQAKPGEDPGDLARRLLAEIREKVAVTR